MAGRLAVIAGEVPQGEVLYLQQMLAHLSSHMVQLSMAAASQAEVPRIPEDEMLYVCGST